MSTVQVIVPEPVFNPDDFFSDGPEGYDVVPVAQLAVAPTVEAVYEEGPDWIEPEDPSPLHRQLPDVMGGPLVMVESTVVVPVQGATPVITAAVIPRVSLPRQVKRNLPFNNRDICFSGKISHTHYKRVKK
jgi:hypothetical protein